MTTRNTITRNRQFSDIDLNFTAHPVTGDIIRLQGDRAISASIKNLIFTNFYERPFRPGVGSGVVQYLFENITPMTEHSLKTAIELVIRNYEPRASLQDVRIRADSDRNGFDVSIVYFGVNIPAPVVINLFLNKVRF